MEGIFGQLDAVESCEDDCFNRGTDFLYHRNSQVGVLAVKRLWRVRFYEQSNRLPSLFVASIQVFMAGMDQGDSELLQRSVTTDLDVDYLKDLHYPMGPMMLSTQINDIKRLETKEGTPRKFLVRVAIQTWAEKITIDYWDLTVIETDFKKYKTGLGYLVTAYTPVSSIPVDEHRVFPGYTYKF